MQCEEQIKAFGALYKDGLSLNTDRKVKTSETPISILEESDIQYQKGDHIDVYKRQIQVL